MMIKKTYLTILSVAIISMLFGSLFYHNVTLAEREKETTPVEITNLPLDEEGNLKVKLTELISFDEIWAAISELQSRLDNLNTTLTSRIEGLEEQITDLQIGIATLQALTNSLNASLAELESRVETLETQIPPIQEQLVFITITFCGTSGSADNSIVTKVRNIGTANITIIMYKLGYGNTAHDIPDVTIAPGDYADVYLPVGADGQAWTDETTYDVYLITSYGNNFYTRVTAGGDGVEWLEIYDATFWGTSGASNNRIILTVRNVGTKDVTVDKYKLGYFGIMHDITNVVVVQGGSASVTLTTGADSQPWTSGTTYEIYLYTTTGRKFSYCATAP